MLVTSCSKTREIKVWQCTDDSHGFDVNVAHTFHVDDFIKEYNPQNITASHVDCALNCSGTGLVVFAQTVYGPRAIKLISVFVIDVATRESVSFESSTSRQLTVCETFSVTTSRVDNMFAVQSGLYMTIWDISAGPSAPVRRFIMPTDNNTLKSVCFGSSSGTLVRGVKSEIVLYDLVDRSEIGRLHAVSPIQALCVSTTQMLLAACGDKAVQHVPPSICIFDLQSMSHLISWAPGHRCESIEFSSDGERLLTYSLTWMTVTTCIWNPRTGERLLSLTGHNTACWFNNCKIVVSSRAAVMKVIDAETGTEIVEWMAHDDASNLRGVCPSMVILM
jgi:hypothetical protein